MTQLRCSFITLAACCLLLPLRAAWADDVAKPDVRLEGLAKDLHYGLEYKRMLVVQALGRFETPVANEILITTMLRDRSKPVRRAAQRELGHLSDQRTYPAIQTALKDPDRGVRLAALDALGLVRDPQAANLILSAVQAAPKDNDLVLTAFESLRDFVYRIEPLPGFETGLAPYVQHPDKRVRRIALTILGLLGRSGSLPALMVMWPNADDQDKIRLADAFANIGWEPPVKLLAAGLDNRKQDIVIHCVYALSQIESHATLPKLRDLLEKSKEARVRMACLAAMIGIPDPDNIPAALAALSDPDPSVRHWSAYVLGQLKAKTAISALEEKLRDPAPLVRASAVTALAELQAKDAERKFLDLLADRTQPDEVRIATAQALDRIHSRQGAELFWSELQRKELSTEARLTFGFALGSVRDEAYREKLVPVLTEGDFAQAFTAALALGAMGDIRAQAILLKSLDHGLPTIRRYAILGLEGFRDREVATALAETANDDLDPVVRILCASSLVAAGFTDFRVLLWNALDHKDEDVRSEALIALGRSADADTLKQLKWYLRREPSVPVRETIWRILREHGK